MVRATRQYGVRYLQLFFTRQGNAKGYFAKCDVKCSVIGWTQAYQIWGISVDWGDPNAAKFCNCVRRLELRYDINPWFHVKLKLF